MIRAAVFAVGSELLEGSITDTNSAWLSARLAARGVDIERVELLPDDMDRLVRTFDEALSAYDIVLTTGGLGPTFDDMTAEAVARAADVPFEINDTALAHITERLSSRGIELKERHHHQARLPAGCTLFENTNGTAHGFGVFRGASVIISMPGIPYEMKGMFDDSILSFLEGRFSLTRRHMVDMRFAGVPESNVDDIVTGIGIPEAVECIINVGRGEILVKLRSFDPVAMDAFRDKIRSALKDYFVGYGAETLASVAVRLLGERGLTVSVAESCTGGMLGAEFTSVPGASDVFIGGAVTYANAAKMSILGVAHATIEANGAVSEEVAEAMAKGACRTFSTPCSVSITGVAGPGGGTPDKPVGTVCIGIVVGDAVDVKRYLFPGDRDSVRVRSVNTALRSLAEMVRREG